ncbi:MAG: hypothetical protein IKE46_08090 [Selenomonadaceae bacterium]|nr:hypothetical protein [Selenomonadaceae bacterium]MBR4384136.1 hypothetical protein [Selenomonadaceae bacterium]
MTEPDHKVKRHIVPFNDKEKPHWNEYPVHGWLGSGVKDKNGVEIFEGDILLWIGYGNKPRKLPVSFHDGCFWYKDIDGNDYTLEPEDAQFYEVVGHVATEDEQ